MATFTFNIGGRSYDVDAPEGADEGDAYAKLQNFLKQSGAAKPQGPTPKQLGAMAMEDTPGWQKPLVNLGAGLDTFWQGAKQLFPSVLGKGPSDAELKESRAFKEAAAEGQPLGGLTQFVGESLPTMVVPGGGFAKGASALIKGGTTLPKMLALATEGAGVGGVMGAFEPVTSQESRLKNVVGGAAGGAVLTPALGAVGSRVLPAARSALSGDFGDAALSLISPSFTKAGASERAAQEIIDKLGADRAQGVVDTLHGAPGTPGPVHQPELFPRSTADVAFDTQLGQMERQSRLDAQAAKDPRWAEFDQVANEQKVQALRDATTPSQDIAALTSARDTATTPMRDKALQQASNDLWFHTPVQERLQNVLNGPSGSNPSTQKVVNYVMNELGNGITPERLYTVRKVLADRLEGPMSPGIDELGSAAKGAQRDTMSIINSIDAALNQASGGKWQKYLDRYSAMSDPVTSAKAQGRIWDTMTDTGAPQTAGVTGPVPAITGTRLGNVMAREGQNDFGSTLSTEAQKGLDDLLGAIRSNETLMKNIKLAGTSGGGPTTAMDLLGSAAKGALNAKTGGITGMAQGAWQALTQPRMRAAMADALQNPQLFVRSVQQALDRGQALTFSQQVILNALRGSIAGAPAALNAPTAQ